MNKLKLKVEDLQVDTFGTAPAEKGKGTVLGEQCSCDTGCETVYHTCADTCGYNCVSKMTCDYMTCAGFATVYQGHWACIEC